MPHTLASVEKRQAALEIIYTEQPEVTWKLLESLLPNQHLTTSGTHKPSWRKTIPEDWKKGVTNSFPNDHSAFGNLRCWAINLHNASHSGHFYLLC
jgi:hypothetical protein